MMRGWVNSTCNKDEIAEMMQMQQIKRMRFHCFMEK